MNENNLKFTNFAYYCFKCKHRLKAEYEDPCNECLEVPAQEGTEKPLCFEEKETRK